MRGLLILNSHAIYTRKQPSSNLLYHTGRPHAAIKPCKAYGWINTAEMTPVIINAGYTHSTSVYNNDNEYGGTSYHEAFTYPISSVNLLAGISYSL